MPEFGPPRWTTPDYPHAPFACPKPVARPAPDPRPAGHAARSRAGRARLGSQRLLPAGVAPLVAAAVRQVLDVGCGVGAFAARLAQRAEQVDALDRSAEMIGPGRQPPDPHGLASAADPTAPAHDFPLPIHQHCVFTAPQAEQSAGTRPR
ncbi:methyltransferase domain-containing protein [Yinghuangia sp. YIM S10712]|uniref:methyltransferase domain-containing protein n=1 Tax=Yinghuangia sp. YIM S10712 TaxID=3436930 RepID=UPI003F538965